MTICNDGTAFVAFKTKLEERRIGYFVKKRRNKRKQRDLFSDYEGTLIILFRKPGEKIWKSCHRRNWNSFVLISETTDDKAS